MPAKSNPPARIVAELGRPETPQEAAERRAAAARKRRSNQTLTNLLLSLAACLAVVLVLVLVAVRPNLAQHPEVDYHRVAEQSQEGITEPLADPALPHGWSANAAHLDTEPSDGVTTWYIGFLTPDGQFIGLRQGIGANQTWLADQLQNSRPTGVSDISGVAWRVYDARESKDPGNLAYALTATRGPSSFVLFGTAKTAEFTTLANALARQLGTTG